MIFKVLGGFWGSENLNKSIKIGSERLGGTKNEAKRGQERLRDAKMEAKRRPKRG